MNFKYIFQLVLLGAIWGSSYLFLRIAAPAIGVPLTMGLRLTIAAIVMVTFFAFLKKLPKYRTCWKQYFILGNLNLLIPFGLTSFAITQLNASIGAILNATTPLFVMLVSSVWLQEKISGRKLLGLLIGISGLVILLGWIPVDMNMKTILAIIGCLLASLSYSFASVYTRVHMKSADPITTATGQLSIAALLSIPLMATSSAPSGFNSGILWVILTLALVCTALGYGLYFNLIARIGAANASIVTLIVPVFSVIWSMAFLNEPLTPSIIIGLALMLASLKIVLSPAAPATLHSVAEVKQK